MYPNAQFLLRLVSCRLYRIDEPTLRVIEKLTHRPTLRVDLMHKLWHQNTHSLGLNFHKVVINLAHTYIHIYIY